MTTPRLPVACPSYGEPAPTQLNFPIRPLLGGEGRCQDCGKVLPNDELNEAPYGYPTEILILCDECRSETDYGQCYSCGNYFMARKLNGPSDEVLVELYDPAELAALQDNIPEVVCLGCELDFDRRHTSVPSPEVGTDAKTHERPAAA